MKSDDETLSKMRQLFEAASRLTRSQQQKLAAIIEPFIAHHAGR